MLLPPRLPPSSRSLRWLPWARGPWTGGRGSAACCSPTTRAKTGRTAQVFTAQGGTRRLCTIAHKKITELIPKQFRFGNSSTKITEYNSHSNSVKDSGAHTTYRNPLIPETNRFGNHRAGITENNSKRIKFGSVIFLCVMVPCTWKPPNGPSKNLLGTRQGS